MDNVSNANPQEFIAMGATPEVAADLARQADAMAGRRGFAAQAEAMHSMDSYVPPPKAAPPTPATAQELSDLARAHDMSPVNDALSAHFAPPVSSSDYEFPSVENPTDEGIASDSALKEALHAERIPANMVRNITADIAETGRAWEKQTTAQREATLDSTISRVDSMWKKEGSSYEQGMATIKEALQRIQNPSVRQAIVKHAPLFTPLNWDSIYQWAKHAR